MGAKITLSFGIFLCLVGIYFLISPYIIHPNYYSDMTIEQITEVPGIRHSPVLPDGWEIESIQRYDDGFTSPYVRIIYGSDIHLRIKSGNWRIYNRSYEKVEIGDKIIDFYNNGKQLEYIFYTESLSYSILSPTHLKETVENFLESIEEHILQPANLNLEHMSN